MKIRDVASLILVLASFAFTHKNQQSHQNDSGRLAGEIILKPSENHELFDLARSIDRSLFKFGLKNIGTLLNFEGEKVRKTILPSFETGFRNPLNWDYS